MNRKMMKKVLVSLMSLLLTYSLFAQSAEYEKYLAQAKQYESQKKWCYALGAYYDALATDDEPSVKQEAYDGYIELSSAISSGNPGKGKFNVFSIHDEWKKLLIDAEKYGSSISKYELIIGNLVQGELNYSTKTASYSASVKFQNGDRYNKTIGIIKEGYETAYKDDWSSDLPHPYYWPCYSVSSNNNSAYNMDGALIYVYEWKDIYRNTHRVFYNAFDADDTNEGWRSTLYDYKFNIIDESGKEVVKGKRFLLGAEKAITFDGVTPDVMDLIENGKAFINPVSLYLEYGKYNLDDDNGGRTFIKNLPEVTLLLENAVFHGTNLKGDVKGDNFRKTAGFFALQECKFVDIPDQQYSMSETEVTQFFYEAVMNENPSYYVGDERPVERVSWYDAIYFCNELSIIAGKEPVYSLNGSTDVSTWAYIPHNGKSIKGNITQNANANGFRLPTNEEWEYAAKGGQDFTVLMDGGHDYFEFKGYSGSDNLDEVGWYNDNSDRKTHPVAQKKANGYGLYDMSGNVWEWCWDLNDSNKRYMCGGSYDEKSWSCAVDSSDLAGPSYRDNNLGFRIVCSPSK